LAKWRATAAKSGGKLYFNDLVDIAASPVSDAQLKHIPGDLRVGHNPSNWESYRLYASLGDNERKLAASDKGLKCRRLSEVKRRLADIAAGTTSVLRYTPMMNNEYVLLPPKAHVESLRVYVSPDATRYVRIKYELMSIA